MSDTVKTWLDERQTIHSEGAGVLLRNPYELNREYDLWDEDAEAIADAHNNLPRALDALNAVLEEHKPMPNSSSALFPTPACTCGENYPCPTVQAIEGAISE